MTPEQIVLPVVNAIGQRPRLSSALFKFSRWGDPFAPERFSYPYPIYETMAADGPVVYSRAYRQWFVTGYDEVFDVLRSADVSSALVMARMLKVTPYTKLSPLALDSFSKWLLLNDPPDHTRLRSVVSRAFTPKRIAGYAPRVADIATDLLEAVADQPNPDVVEGFTGRLPVYVIAELLGLPRDRWAWFAEASGHIAGMLEAFNPFDPVVMSGWFEDLHAYFSTIIDERRERPEDDLISALAAAEDGEVLTTDEVVAMIGVLLFAGHETTTGLLGNSIVALGRFPDQRDLLRSQPDLIDNAVEELLRFDSPAQTTGRIATADIKVGDATVPKGSILAIFVGAANRDKRRWPDADELRLDRPDPKSLSFGHGIHHCLGAALARLETKVALPLFLEAFGDYAVDLTNATWKRSHSLRGPTTLRVTRG